MTIKKPLVLFVLLLAVCTTVRAQPLGEQTLPIDLDEAARVWDFDARKVEVVTDALLRSPAFAPRAVPRQAMGATFTSKLAFEAPVVIEALVRLPTVVAEIPRGGFSRAAATLRAIAPEQADPESESSQAQGFSVSVSRGRFRDEVSYQISAAAGEQSWSRQITPLYSVDSISPLMDEHIRLILERRAGQLPVAHQRVHRLRLELRPTGARMYVNGRLVGESFDQPLPCKAALSLKEQAHVLGMTVRPLVEQAGAFIPVPLDDHCNANGPGNVPGLDPRPGAIAQVHGVPMIRSSGPTGADHLDVRPSVYLHRMGNMRVGDARESVHQPEMMDVTRFTLRVPQRTYRRAWVLAASDGDPNGAPVLTIRFYRQRTPWVADATVHDVPTFEATTAPGQAQRLEWKSGDSKIKSLWLIPIELDAAALAADPMDAIEITKAIYPYRGYPDPAYYNAYPGGLPSSVRLYALTLEEAPLWARGTGTKNGNLYVDGETPAWRVLLKNLSDTKIDAQIDLLVTDPYGQSASYQKQVALDAGPEQREVCFEPATPVFGLYTVRTTVRSGDFTQSRQGTFLKLPPRHDKATGANSPWGLWCWNGGHQTNPDPEDNMRLLKALGAINNYQHADRPNPKEPPVSLYDLRKKYGLGAMHYRLVERNIPDWAMKHPYDPADYAAYSEEKGLEAARALAENPDLIFVNFFAENYLSLRLTHGMSPWAMGQPWFEYTPAEEARLRAHWLVAKAAYEGVKKHAPSLKILFGHGAGNFVQPFFLLEDWKNYDFDGFGMDLPQFERMPERQPRATEPSLLYFLHHQMKEHGQEGKEVVHLESYFPSSGPMALTFEQQADSVVRTAVLSMALGTTRFMRAWSLHTSGDGWGSSHYGTAGLIDRWPEFNPKPAAAAFATMTRVLDLARYDGWLETGSRSAFCVRFKDTDRLVYALWTFRGTRPLTLTFQSPTLPRGGIAVTRTDLHGNTFPVEVQAGQATVTLSPTPQWIEVRNGAVTSASVGEPTYTEAPPPPERHKVLENFERAEWTYDPNPYQRYQTNHWDMPRAPGSMTYQRVRSQERGSNVLRVELTDPDQSKPMVGFYGVFAPPKPIDIPGRARALGLWVNGRSAWNRFIYEVTDAQGEVWLSCGTRDAWNCDDIHSWSSINHDGWRYLRFPLPATAPGDNYREADTTWWGSDGDGIVDLPLKLTRIMIEMRPRMIYVNEMLPVESLTLELDDLTAEYDQAQDMTNAPVLTQRDAAKVLMRGKLLPLPNPIAALGQTGAGAPPTIDKVYPPEQGNTGTRLFVEVSPVPGATRYVGYVSAYPDGSGAKPLGIDGQSKHRLASAVKDQPNKLLFDGLIPDRPMYLFVTAIDADGRESKPSAVREVVLKDEFPFK